MLQVQKKQCDTCIFKQGLGWPIEALLDDVRDPNMEGHFRGYRICHSSKTACCAGFWARYKDNFDLGQVAQRLGFVEYVVHKEKPWEDVVTEVTISVVQP